MNYYIDGGWRFGEALAHFKVQNSKNWDIHAFEPNPAVPFDEFPWVYNLTRHRKAIWTANTTLPFKQFECPTRGANMGGRCGIDQETIDFEIPPTGTAVVQGIDFAEFLEGLEDRQAVWVKLDIEGAEFPVLRHLLETNTARLMTGLWVETHQRWSSTENDNTTRALLRSIAKQGVEVRPWA